MPTPSPSPLQHWTLSHQLDRLQSEHYANSKITLSYLWDRHWTSRSYSYATCNLAKNTRSSHTQMFHHIASALTHLERVPQGPPMFYQQFLWTNKSKEWINKSLLEKLTYIWVLGINPSQFLSDTDGKLVVDPVRESLVRFHTVRHRGFTYSLL